jgi:type I restriction enzyme M protein
MKENDLDKKDSLGKILWAIADKLRGQMDADKFKDYILGFIFLKFLCDEYVKQADEVLKNDNITFLQLYEHKNKDLSQADAEQIKKLLEEEMVKKLGYNLKPKHLWNTIYNNRNNNDSIVEQFLEVFNHLSQVANSNNLAHNQFNLFESVDLNSSNLGTTHKARNETIIKIIEELHEKLSQKDYSQDELGDAYEYLISKFASSSGKKAGEFYTPSCVSTILAKLVSFKHSNSAIKKHSITSVYDPTCGSGSLLCNVYNTMQGEVGKIYAQEKNHTSYNLARMNLFLHKIKYNNFDIALGDTLVNPNFLNTKFEAIVANPPFSLDWEPDLISAEDERFINYPKPPKSNADLAFVVHCLHLLKDDGTAAIILPHGVLFRGNKEKEIRKAILHSNTHGYLDCVIGLAPNLFFSTSIPVCILVFKKCRTNDDILFIQASGEYKKDKNQNILEAEHINKIVDAFSNRQEIDKFSKKIKLQQIIDNDYNLNITRYIDNSIDEEQIDLEQVVHNLNNLNEAEQQVQKIIDEFSKTLGIKSC